MFRVKNESLIILVSIYFLFDIFNLRAPEEL